MRNFKYLYGPVYSWRIGRSLGIDPLSLKRKICTFDCIYCQIGRKKAISAKPKVFIPEPEILKEIKSLPALKIDYITFSGAGEPSLAKNIGQLISSIKKITHKKIAILTNSTLLVKKSTQKALRQADFVIAKLDAATEEVFYKVNRPAKGITLKEVIKGIKSFKSRYRGRFAIQIMFMKDNKDYAKELADITKDIKPDEVQINTPLRPCRVKPLSKKEMDRIKKHFKGLKVVSVYDVKKKKTKPISTKSTLKRRGKI